MKFEYLARLLYREIVALLKFSLFLLVPFLCFDLPFSDLTERYKYHINYISITMVMDTLQIRLSKGLVKKIDEVVKSDLYHSRSEFIREAVRKVLMEQLHASSLARLHHDDHGPNHVFGRGKKQFTHFREPKHKQDHYIL
jgi:Arc/MetJ-type ribon-helix-helix transcriptional regulator